MKNLTSRVYDTHFERAEQLGKTPAQVKRMALSFKLGPYGSSGGVIYFPRDGTNMQFFEKMMNIRYFP